MKKPIPLGAAMAAGLMALAVQMPAQAQQTIKLANLLELTGPIASAGTNYRNGLELAVKEINASGGILGRKIETEMLDTQSNPGVAKAMASKAVDMDVFAAIGPTFSGAMVVSANETRRAEIPNFTGAAAASITSQGNPYVIRTNATQATAMPKVARYMAETLKAKTVDIIYVNSDFGKGGRDEFIKAAKALGMTIGADVSTDQAQVDFSSAVVKAKQASGDVLFAYTNEEESARLLRELRKQGYTKPVMGDTTLVSQKTIELAGEAANGALGVVPLTADAPTDAMRAFDKKYFEAYKIRSDHNGIQGYTVPYIIKAVSEKIGKIDRKEFAARIKNMPLYVKEYPGLLMDVKFNTAGDPDRVSYLVEVKNGKQQVLETLPATNAF